MLSILKLPFKLFLIAFLAGAIAPESQVLGELRTWGSSGQGPSRAPAQCTLCPGTLVWKLQTWSPPGPSSRKSSSSFVLVVIRYLAVAVAKVLRWQLWAAHVVPRRQCFCRWHAELGVGLLSWEPKGAFRRERNVSGEAVSG